MRMLFTRILDTSEVLVMLKLGDIQALEWLIRRERLPALKVNGEWVFLASEVERWRRRYTAQPCK